MLHQLPPRKTCCHKNGSTWEQPLTWAWPWTSGDLYFIWELWRVWGSFGDFCISSVISFFRKTEISFSGKFLNRYKNAHRCETGVRFIFHLSGGSTKTRVREFSGFTHSFLTLLPGNTEQGQRSEWTVCCLKLCSCVVHSLMFSFRAGMKRRRSKRFLWSRSTWASLTHTSSCSVCKRFLSEAVWAMQVNPGSGSCSGTKLLLNAELLIFITVYDMTHEARYQGNILQPHLSSAQVRAPSKGKRVQPPALTSSSSGV